MILVDTSIWIDHINKGGIEPLDDLLAGESVVVHDFVIGEIAMGSLKNRSARLAFLRDLHRIPTALDREVQVLVESANLHGSGLSYIDAHLLTAALAFGEGRPVRIWTGDKSLRDQTERLGISFRP